MRPLAKIEGRLGALLEAEAGTEADAAGSPRAFVSELLSLSEEVLERWVASRGERPTLKRREGFRLLALHRQGAKGDPSFHAVRETCREIVYRYNLVSLDPDHAQAARRARIAARVAMHLFLFVTGKMETEKIGKFCCSSRPLHVGDAGGDRSREPI